MKSKTIRTARFITLSGIYLARGIGAVLKQKFKQPAAPPKGDDLSFIIYSIIPWSGVWQRPQHFATQISKHHRVLYVDPVGLQHIVSSSDPAPEEITEVNDNLTVFRPRVLPGGKTKSTVINLNDAMVLNRIQTLIQDMKLSNPVLVTNNPLTDNLAAKYPWKTVVYDVIDDFISTSWAPPDAKTRELRLFKSADTVFTGTYSLWNKKNQFHSDIEYIPCGVEVDHFLKANNPATEIPDNIKSLPKPVFGYFGGLNERLDAQLITELAEAFPHGSVVLIGPVFADFGLSDFTDRWASVLSGPESPGFQLKDHPDNIHILGIKPYDQLPNYLKGFDVCLLPYVFNDVTRDIHPVKILEYLASGCPVVSTYLPDIERFYQDVVSIAGSRSDFINAAKHILADDTKENQQKRISFAQSKTWDNMAMRMRQKVISKSGSR